VPPVTTNDRPLLYEIPEFGRIDAESENQLADFFIRTLAYRRVVDVERIIVLGRKGTGKTAIYKALLQRSARFRTTHAVGLEFRNYPWDDHTRASDRRLAHSEQFIESWQFLVLVELAKLVLLSPRAIPATAHARAALGSVTHFLRMNWGQIQFNFRDTFARPRYVLTPDADTDPSEMMVSASDSAAFSTFLIRANRWLKARLSALLAPDYTYFILFDDLDHGYAPGDPVYSARLVGLPTRSARSIRSS
jgi:hypothetical protein